MMTPKENTSIDSYKKSFDKLTDLLKEFFKREEQDGFYDMESLRRSNADLDMFTHQLENLQLNTISNCLTTLNTIFAFISCPYLFEHPLYVEMKKEMDILLTNLSKDLPDIHLGAALKELPNPFGIKEREMHLQAQKIIQTNIRNERLRIEELRKYETPYQIPESHKKRIQV